MKDDRSNALPKFQIGDVICKEMYRYSDKGKWVYKISVPGFKVLTDCADESFMLQSEYDKL